MTQSHLAPATAKVQREAAAPGRPRSEAVDTAVLAAMENLLQRRSYVDLSMEAIAAEAGVSKASVYRRWPNKSALMVEVLKRAAQTMAEQRPFKGTHYREHLIQAMQGLRSMLSSCYADAIVTVISEAQKDAELRERFYQGFIEPVQRIGDLYVEAAVARGEVRADTDKNMIFDQLFGTFYYRLLIIRKPITDEYLEHIVDSVLKQMR